MTNLDPYETLLAETLAACFGHPVVRAFAPFPTAVKRQPLDPHYCPCSDYFETEAGWPDDTYDPLRRALLAVSPTAHWRETYKGTDIGSDFTDRFGCYSIIGPGGPFASDTGRVWMVYMPPDLDYPDHHHPAQEMYLIVSGSAEFRKAGAPNETLRAGDTAIHVSNQPHAMQTHDEPVLCLVIWKDEFETPPVLTSGV